MSSPAYHTPASSPQKRASGGQSASSSQQMQQQQQQQQMQQQQRQQQQQQEPYSDGSSDDSSDLEEFNRGKGGQNKKGVNRLRLTEEEYEFIAADIMSKPPMSGYLKYHLPLKYAARTEEVRWVWPDPQSGDLVYKELIGGGKNSDLEYD